VRNALLPIAILIASGVIAAAIWLKPTSFERCVAMIGSDIEHQATLTAATLDPRDVQAQAARICSGQEQ
jgi:hypothetical protein